MINSQINQDEVIETSKSRHLLPWSIVILVMIVILFLLTPAIEDWHQNAYRIKSEDIVIAKVKRDDLMRDLAVNGQWIAPNSPVLYSEQAGEIHFRVKPGEKIKKGNVIAEIINPELRSELLQAKSNLQKIKLAAMNHQINKDEQELELQLQLDTANLRAAVAQRKLLRAQQSRALQVISEADFHNAQDEFDTAQLIVNNEKKRLLLAKKRLKTEQKTQQQEVSGQALIVDELKRRLDTLLIHSPIDGAVGEWLVEKGQQIQASQGVIKIVDHSHYHAELDVPEFYAGELDYAMRVKLNIKGEIIDGTITSISPEIKDGTLKIHVAPQITSHKNLRENQRLQAKIILSSHPNVLMLKRGTFLNTLRHKNVYVLENNDYAKSIPIEIGTIGIEYVEIKSGVKENDQIIISSYESFNEHQQLKIIH